MGLKNSTLVTLGFGVHALTRGAGAVQFGVDPTRSGIVETPAAALLAKVLSETNWPVGIGELRDSLASSCGVDSTAARSLIDDLCSYRILVPSQPKSVAVLGTTPLAREIRRLLSTSGASVRIPLISEDTSAFLDRQASTPIVVVDRAHEYLKFGRNLRQHPGWLVPALSLDSRVLLGPVARGGSPVCPMCVLMQLHDGDEHISQALRDVAERPRTMDPVVAATGAAAAVAAVRRLAGIPDPPGVVADAPEPGWTAMVDPLGPQLVTPFDARTHPLCPACAS